VSWYGANPTFAQQGLRKSTKSLLRVVFILA